MGVFGSTLKAVQTKVDQSRSGSDVTGQVKMFFDEAVEAVRTGQVVAPEFFVNAPGVFAGQMTEAQMLEGVEALIEQLQCDGRRALPAEVRLNIIIAIRDLKIGSLEQDGFVNPIDKTVIQMQAAGLKLRARFCLTGARMVRGNKPEDASAILDAVEVRLLEDAAKEHGRNYDKWQRAAQAAIWAVGELRQQQLVSRP